MDADFQSVVNLGVPSGPQPTHLIAYMQNGEIKTVELKNASVGLAEHGGTDLEQISKEVMSYLDLKEDIKIIAITDLGMH
ncbi:MULTISPECIES: hypothetical protein [Acinetobacter]|uniref:hypothetical protein n=1 Tax=Acinetobacter TaxID=469 RepID=UPI0007D061D5|nr:MULTISPECIES: hypothetical protein [unclassified Acinetobacter]OAL80569.1 hypothetical protein AY607_02435 [Acinetobacter sp. SFA]OAL84484.1 hypothetical protein AY605_07425 [Acinetobacter sp. SFD]